MEVSEEVKQYMISKAREFESLRKMLNRDINTLKDQLRMVGHNADRDVMRVSQKASIERDGHWMAALNHAFGWNFDAWKVNSMFEYKGLAMILTAAKEEKDKVSENSVQTGEGLTKLPASGR